MLYVGFDVPHMDGNHTNNNPSNLVLIEHGDHMMLHGKKRRLGRVDPKRGKRGPLIGIGDRCEPRKLAPELAPDATGR